MDGLKAINVYVIETDDGLTLIDGGWAIEVARELLDQCLRDVGLRVRRHPPVPGHAHPPRPLHDGRRARARARRRRRARPRREAGPRPAQRSRDHRAEQPVRPGARHRRRRRLAELWSATTSVAGMPDPALWRYPDTWLEGDLEIAVGARTLDAVHTPGHTPGHYVYADRADGLLFAGDHVLPTITPVDRVHDAAGRASARRLHGVADQGPRPARPADPARPRPARAVLAHPGRRAARPPRGPAGEVAGRVGRRPAQPSQDVARQLPLDPPRACLRRARRVQPGHGRRWRPRRTSSCWWPGARRPVEVDDEGVVAFAAVEPGGGRCVTRSALTS